MLFINKRCLAFLLSVLVLAHARELNDDSASIAIMKAKYWVSITGLELKSVLRYPQFLLHAVPSMAQAQSAKGNISASARTVAGIEHTLTIWESRQEM